MPYKLGSFLILLLLLSGCNLQPSPPPPVANPDLQAVIDAKAVQRFEFKPGKSIGREGAFFLDPASGAVEGWSVPKGTGLSYNVSADNRWVSAVGEPNSFLVDRQTQAVYRWESRHGTLLAARGDRLLFAAGTRAILTDGDLATLSVLADLEPEPAKAEATFAPDGSAVLLTTGRNVYLVKAPTGESSELRNAGTRLFAAPRSAPWFGLTSDPECRFPTSFDGLGVNRFSWSGESYGDMSAHCAGFQLGPDGALTAMDEQMAGLTTAVSIATVGMSWTPSVRLKGASFCFGDLGYAGDRWLADGSGIAVRAATGYGLLTVDGRLLSPTPGVPEAVSGKEVVPAPDRPDRFAVGRTAVFDTSGARSGAVVDGTLYPGALAPWGETSDRLRFVLTKSPPVDRCSPLPLPPLVEPPFSADPVLTVGLPPSECLDLREGPSSTTAPVTCVAGESRVTAARPAMVKGGPNPGAVQVDGEWWVQVVAGQEQRGWIPVTAGKVTWAPPGKPAGAGRPTWVDALAGEVRSQATWFHIATTGEDPCAGNSSAKGCIAVTDFSQVTESVISHCRRDSPGEARNAPGYDPALHEPLIGPYARACGILEVAESKLGLPADTPEWRQQVRDAEAALSQIRFP